MRNVARLGRSLIATVAFGALVAAPAVAAPAATRVLDRALDPSARGVVTYENTANVASYQQNGILTYRGWQYTGWYRDSRRAVIARRKLPAGRWQSTELDYELFADDSHNTIAMTVTPSDGRIHLAFPTHVNQLRYTRSIPGVADHPRRFNWSSKLFETTKNQFTGAPQAPTTLTYPQFEQVRGRTLLTYRDGITNNGGQVLLRYDDTPTGTWSFLGRFTSAAGSYTSKYGTSTSRYSYLHGFSADPKTGDLAITWTWREQNASWCPGPLAVGNHDTSYAVSHDGGATWDNNAGERIAITGSDDITIDDPAVVQEIPIDVGLINQETQAYDSRGRLHVVTSSVPQRDLASIGGCVNDFYIQRKALATPTHTWRSPDGRWHSLELPTRSNSSGRTKLLFDKRDNAYVVLPDARIMASTAVSGWSDWRLVFSDPAVHAVSELVIDRTRLTHDGILTVAYQEPSVGGAPSAYRLADFSLRPGHDRPRATDPAASPRPFAGTAD